MKGNDHLVAPLPVHCFFEALLPASVALRPVRAVASGNLGDGGEIHALDAFRSFRTLDTLDPLRGRRISVAASLLAYEVLKQVVARVPQTRVFRMGGTIVRNAFDGLLKRSV